MPSRHLHAHAVAPLLGAREELARSRLAGHQAEAGPAAGADGQAPRQLGRRAAAGQARRAAAARASRCWRSSRRRSRRRTQRAAGRSGKAHSPAARPGGAAEQLRVVQGLLPARGRDLPGRHAVPGRPQLRAHGAGAGHGQARRARGPGQDLPGVLRLHAPGREDEHRRGLHRRRRRLSFRRPQRRVLRPPGPRLGRHHHQADREPDQRGAGLLCALQEVRARDRGAGGQARRRAARPPGRAA
jgi:hypothetical protein